MQRIMVVEDEEPILIGLRDNLEMEGYEVATAMDGEEALAQMDAFQPHLVLLDLMLPGKSGFEVCRAIRRKYPTVHVILLTAKADESAKITGLEMGADDYVTKPFSLLELLARIRSAMRRRESMVTPKMESTEKENDKEDEILKFDDIEINFKRFTAQKGNVSLDLNSREFQMLRYFVSRKGEVVLREELLEQVWGYQPDNMPTTRTVDNHMVKLRQKMEVDPANPKRLISIRGVGYRLDL
jgi:DNA-binding response OmpR family regulator